MTSSKDRCHLASPDIDPSIALAQAARQDFERPALHQLIEQAKRERAEYTAALLRRFAALLKSAFRASAGGRLTSETTTDLLASAGMNVATPGIR
jgi:hypothetical protein